MDQHRKSTEIIEKEMRIQLRVYRLEISLSGQCFELFSLQGFFIQFSVEKENRIDTVEK
jgi:hypothetical protein